MGQAERGLLGDVGGIEAERGTVAHCRLDGAGGVADDQADIGDASVPDGLEAVEQHGLVGDGDELLRRGVGNRPEPGTCPPSQNQRLHNRDTSLPRTTSAPASPQPAGTIRPETSHPRQTTPRSPTDSGKGRRRRRPSRPAAPGKTLRAREAFECRLVLPDGQMSFIRSSRPSQYAAVVRNRSACHGARPSVIGPPSPRTVDRNASPTPNLSSSPLPASARSGRFARTLTTARFPPCPNILAALSSSAGRSVRTGTCESSAASNGLPSLSRKRSAPWRRSSRTPSSTSTSPNGSGAVTAALALASSARWISVRPHRPGVLSANVPNMARPAGGCSVPLTRASAGSARRRLAPRGICARRP